MTMNTDPKAPAYSLPSPAPCTTCGQTRAYTVLHDGTRECEPCREKRLDGSATCYGCTGDAALLETMPVPMHRACWQQKHTDSRCTIDSKPYMLALCTGGTALVPVAIVPGEPVPSLRPCRWCGVWLHDGSNECETCSARRERMEAAAARFRASHDSTRA